MCYGKNDGIHIDVLKIKYILILEYACLYSLALFLLNSPSMYLDNFNKDANYR